MIDRKLAGDRLQDVIQVFFRILRLAQLSLGRGQCEQRIVVPGIVREDLLDAQFRLFQQLLVPAADHQLGELQLGGDVAGIQFRGPA